MAFDPTEVYGSERWAGVVATEDGQKKAQEFLFSEYLNDRPERQAKFDQYGPKQQLAMRRQFGDFLRAENPEAWPTAPETPGRFRRIVGAVAEGGKELGRPDRVAAQAFVGSAKGGSSVLSAMGGFVDLLGRSTDHVARNARVQFNNVMATVAPEYVERKRRDAQAKRPDSISVDDAVVPARFLSKVGLNARDFYRENLDVLEREYPAGDITRNPKLAASPEWWAQSIGQTITTMSMAVTAGGGTVGGAAVLGAAMEAEPMRAEMEESGMDPREAFARAVTFGVVVAGLEKVGLDKIFNGKSASRLRRALVAGLSEGATEATEEPAEVILRLAGQEGVTLTQFGEEMIEGLRAGVNVFLPAMVTGGGSGLVRAIEEKRMGEMMEFLDEAMADFEENPAAAGTTTPAALEIGPGATVSTEGDGSQTINFEGEAAPGGAALDEEVPSVESEVPAGLERPGAGEGTPAPTPEKAGPTGQAEHDEAVGGEGAPASKGVQIRLEDRLTDVSDAGVRERLLAEAARMAPVGPTMTVNHLVRQMRTKFDGDELRGRLQVMGVGEILTQPKIDPDAAEGLLDIFGVRIVDAVADRSSIFDLATGETKPAARGGEGVPAAATPTPAPEPVVEDNADTPQASLESAQPDSKPAPAQNTPEAVAAQYGYTLQGGQLVTSTGKMTGVVVEPPKSGRVIVRGQDGKKLYSFAASNPDGLGKFLEQYWYAKKQPAATEPQASPAPAAPEPVVETAGEPSRLVQGDTTSDPLELASRKVGTDLRAGKSVLLVTQANGKVYGKARKATVVSVLDENTVRISVKVPGKTKAVMQEVSIERLQMTPAEEGAKRRAEYFAGIPKDERIRIRDADREFHRQIEQSPAFFGMSAWNNIEAQPSERMKSIRRAAFRRQARDSIRRALNYPDSTDMDDPKVRAEMLPKLPELIARLEQAEGMAGDSSVADIERIKSVEAFQVMEFEMEHEDLLYMDGQWFKVDKNSPDNPGVVRLEDGHVIELTDFESVNVQGVLKPGDPAYLMAFSEHREQLRAEGKAGDIAGESDLVEIGEPAPASPAPATKEILDPVAEWRRRNGLQEKPEQEEMFGKGAVGDAFTLLQEAATDGDRIARERELREAAAEEMERLQRDFLDPDSNSELAEIIRENEARRREEEAGMGESGAVLNPFAGRTSAAPGGSAKVGKVLKQGRVREHSLLQKSKLGVDRIVQGFEQAFLSHPIFVKDNPKIKNDQRVGWAPIRRRVYEFVHRIRASVLDVVEREQGTAGVNHVMDLLWTRDLLARVRRGLAGPENVTEDELQTHLTFLESTASANVTKAAADLRGILDALGRRLQAAGKLSDMHDDYMPHAVIDYLPDFMKAKDGAAAGMQKAFGEPYRAYTKKAMGSERLIETSEATVWSHVAKVLIDESMESWMIEQGERYDRSADWRKQETARQLAAGIAEPKLGRLSAGKRVRVDGKLHVAVPWKRNYFRALAVDERLLRNAAGDHATVREWLGIDEDATLDDDVRMIDQQGQDQGKRLREVMAKGTDEVVLVPLDIGKFFKNMNESSQAAFDFLYVINNITRRWKGMTLTTAGLPFHGNNMIGDSFNTLQFDPGAMRYLDSAGKIARYLYFPGKETQDRLGKLSAWEREVMRVAREQDVADSGSLEEVKKYNPLSKAFDVYQRASEMRESFMRIAILMHQMDRVRAGKPVQRVAGIRIAGLSPEEQAGKVAREALVDYMSTPVVYKRLLSNGLAPFVRFHEANARNHFRAAIRKPLKYWTPLATMAAFAFWWNNESDEERAELDALMPSWIRERNHFTLFEAQDKGKVWVWAPALPADLAWSWLGLDEFGSIAADYWQGYFTIEEARDELLAAAKTGAGDNMKSLMGPFPQFVAGLLTNKDPFTNQRIMDDDDFRLMQERGADGHHMKIMLEYAMEKFITPLHPLMRVDRSEEPVNNRAWDAFVRGPANVRAAFGFYKVDTTSGALSEAYDMALVPEAMHARHKRKVWDLYRKHGKAGRPHVDEYVRQVRLETGVDLREDVIRWESGPKIIIVAAQAELRKTPASDEAGRNRLRSIIEAQRLRQAAERKKQIPKSMR